MILVVDVETSGLIVKDLPLDSPAQPRIVQLGYVVQDSQRRTVHTYCSLMKPPESAGWAIGKEAAAVHGITTEACGRYGVSPRVALLDFASMLETVRLLVGHNLRFDIGLLKREVDLLDEPYRQQVLLRLNRPRLRRVDSMKVGAALTSDGRWPSLARLYGMVVGPGFVETHDALSDAKATASVFWALCDRRMIEL